MIYIGILSILLLISIILNIIFIRKTWYIKNAKEIYVKFKNGLEEQEFLRQLNKRINYWINNNSEKTVQKEMKIARKNARKKIKCGHTIQ